MNQKALYLPLTLSAILSLTLMQCKKETESVSGGGKEYYYYKKGDERDYVVDSSYYEWTTGNYKQYQLLVTEKVVDTFTDLQGNLALRIEQYVSRDSGRSYQFYALNPIVANSSGLQRVEQNQRYVKMITPVKDKKKWNGNAFNNFGYQEYKFSGVAIPYHNGRHRFANCVQVIQQDDSTLISSDRNVEVYGRDTGLVYRYNKSIRYNPAGLPQGSIVVWRLSQLWR